MTPTAKARVVRVVTTHECVVWHLGATLCGLAHEFDVWVVGQDVSQYADRFPGVTWVDVDISRQIRPWRDARALWQLFRLLRRARPDIVHSIMPKAGLLSAVAGWCARVPIRMHTFTGQIWDTQTGLVRWFYQLLDRLVVALNTVSLTDSPSQSRHLQEHGIGLHGRPLPVLGQGSLVGVDLKRFDRARIRAIATLDRAALGLQDRDFVVAYVARKSRHKGALDMLLAFAQARRQAPALRLLFIGPDESGGELRHLCDAQPALLDGVIERGAVMNHEEFLALSDVLCLPSYREGFGSIVIDAAALEVPAVGSHISGLVDSIQPGETGLTFPAGDVDALARLLVQLSGDPERCRAMGLAGRRRVERHFSSAVMTETLASLYRAQLREVHP